MDRGVSDALTPRIDITPLPQTTAGGDEVGRLFLANCREASKLILLKEPR